MSGTIVDGKAIAAGIKAKLAGEVESLKSQGITPGLTVILVGDDSASHTYVKNKQKTCRELGMESTMIDYPETVTQAELVDKLSELNNDDAVHGILVQLPLPKHIDENIIIETISPEKDVDGFHPINIGRMMTKQDSFLPCTPYGILELVKHTGMTIEGKHVVVVGRSNIVGKPVGQLFLNENATVTYCHSRTADLHAYTVQADIIIVAVGIANLIKGDNIKQDAIVIDVGMNRNQEGKLCGDVDFASVKDKASYVTPVPGGVGPMTIAMLMKNTVKAARKTLDQQINANH